MQGALSTTTNDIMKRDTSLEVVIATMRNEMVEFAGTINQLAELMGLRVERAQPSAENPRRRRNYILTWALTISSPTKQVQRLAGGKGRRQLSAQH